MLRLEAQPHKEPSRKQKRRERLTQAERRKFRRLYTDGTCEITGVPDSRKKPHEIHHMHPVQYGGRKTIENLAYIEPETHRKLHKTARSHARNTRTPEAAVIDRLTRDAIQIGKWGRVADGEPPEDVYKREKMIESRLQIKEKIVQMELFQEGAAEA